MSGIQTILMAKRILVVAPHPDDETLGCGGLIALRTDAGATVHALFVTDGSASHPPSAAWPRERLARTREAEAVAALHALGAGDQPQSFLRLPDAAPAAAGSQNWKRAVRNVMTLVDALQPDLAVLPWRRDPHCDHRLAFALVSEALDATASRSLTVLEYAIWLEEFGAAEDFPRKGEAEILTLDITTAMARKRAALQAHRTQLGAIDAEAPGGFTLTAETIARLMTPQEKYYRLCRS